MSELLVSKNSAPVIAIILTCCRRCERASSNAVILTAPSKTADIGHQRVKGAPASRKLHVMVLSYPNRGRRRQTQQMCQDRIGYSNVPCASTSARRKLVNNCCEQSHKASRIN